MALSSRKSRRDVLKLTAYSTAGALLGAPAVRAQTKSLTMMHESSFIQPFDDFFKNTLAAAYEKATGIKIIYELVSVGSLLTRLTTVAETGSGPDMTTIGFNWPFLFDEKLVDVSDIADEIGKKRGGWYDIGAGSRGRQRQVEGDPVRQHRPADELAHRLVQARSGVNEVPRHLGRAARGRHQAQEDGPPVRLRARPRLRRQPRLALSAAVVVRRARGRDGRQDRPHRFRRDGARRSTSAASFYKETMFEDVPRLDRRQQQQGVLSASRSPAPTTPSRSCGRPSSDFPDIAKVTDQALNPQGPKGRFHMLNPQSPRDLHPRPGPGRRPRTSCAG